MGNLTVQTTGIFSGFQNNTDINTALGNLGTMSAGATAPTTASTGLSSLAGLWWHDTSNNILKLRDQADTTWISVATVDETNKIVYGMAVRPNLVTGGSKTYDATDRGAFTIRSNSGLAMSDTVPVTEGYNTVIVNQDASASLVVTPASGTVLVNTEPNCYENPLWIQTVAFNFGLVFAECNDIPGAATTAFIRAEPAAKVDDVVNQITSFLAGGVLVKSDLVTIMVGTNDVLELYHSVRSSSLSPSAALAEAVRRGRLLAAQFDRVTQYGSNDKARALYVLIPNVGDTPYAYAEESGAGGVGSRDLLTSLTRAFNDELRSKITINGRSIGQINLFDTFRTIVTDAKRAADAGILNIKDAACVPADILDCTSATLQPGTETTYAATDATWLWAQGVYFGPIGHSLLSSGALRIIDNNPF